MTTRQVKELRGAAVNKYGKILLKPGDRVEVRRALLLPPAASRHPLLRSACLRWMWPSGRCG
eukprot:92808-Hanusia_phi.AAC.1